MAPSYPLPLLRCMMGQRPRPPWSSNPVQRAHRGLVQTRACRECPGVGGYPWARRRLASLSRQLASSRLRPEVTAWRLPLQGVHRQVTPRD